ncbi:MAG: thioesterase family protein [Burkholderiales bacterium]
MDQNQDRNERRLGFIEHIPIRWGDMDSMGHVNNTVYFRYMEQTRISWFDSLLPRGKGWGSTGIVIASATCNYRRAMTYPGTVEVKLYVGTPGGSSIPTFYEMRVDDDPTPYADGSAVVVCIDTLRNKAVRIPPALRAKLAPLEAAR